MAELQQTTTGAKKKRAFLIFGVVLLADLAVGTAYTNYRRTHIETDDAFIDGNVHAISARVSGMVKSVLVEDNQSVKQGDLLVELDPADYQSKTEAAKANLQLQRANLRLAERELKRSEVLYKSEVNSADRYDKAVSSQEIALAQVRLAEEQVRQAELNLGYTKIIAPSNGRVTRKSVQTGNQVSVGQPLMAVVDLDTLWVIANFKETQMERIRPGQKVSFTVDSYPDKKFSGVVDSIMAGTGASFSLFPAENATGNYVKVVQRIPVKIKIDAGANPDHLLRVGMSVVPTVIVQ